MAYGACSRCGCARNECECEDDVKKTPADLAVMLLAKSLANINLTGGPNPLIEKEEPRPSPTKKPADIMTVGDWVSVVSRGPLRGAAGRVANTSKVGHITIVEIRQLNGNTLRLPRSHFQFAAYAPEVDLDR
jgi:hypothetical protein